MPEISQLPVEQGPAPIGRIESFLNPLQSGRETMAKIASSVGLALILNACGPVQSKEFTPPPPVVDQGRLGPEVAGAEVVDVPAPKTEQRVQLEKEADQVVDVIDQLVKKDFREKYGLNTSDIRDQLKKEGDAKIQEVVKRNPAYPPGNTREYSAFDGITVDQGRNSRGESTYTTVNVATIDGHYSPVRQGSGNQPITLESIANATKNVDQIFNLQPGSNGFNPQSVKDLGLWNAEMQMDKDESLRPTGVVSVRYTLPDGKIFTVGVSTGAGYELNSATISDPSKSGGK